jgi:hypothetical protein
MSPEGAVVNSQGLTPLAQEQQETIKPRRGDTVIVVSLLRGCSLC